MTALDPASEVIRMRRALSEVVSSGARLGESPADGIRLTLPTDDQFWLTLRIADSQETTAEVRWELAEVMARGKHLPSQVSVLSAGSQEEILAEIDTHYRRLLLERRNAACGTPTRARSGL